MLINPRENIGLSQIIEGNPVATIVIDGQHRVTHWNRACEVLTGTLAKDVIGTGNQWKSFYASKRPIMADLIIDDASENAVDRLYHGRFRPSLLIPGGYEAEDYFPTFNRWLFFTAAPLHDKHGKIIGAIASLHFAPTETSQAALLAENVAPDRVHVTGNSVIDALKWVSARIAAEPNLAAGLADLESRSPRLPSHLQAALDAGQTIG